jgi:hypothetical protein
VPDLKRHARNCRVCRHRERHAIEANFVAWQSPSRIARSYRVQRSTLYLHAAAVGLLDERARNVQAALCNFIERSHNVRPTGASFVAAVVALSKLNAEGQSIERISLSRGAEKFANFSRGELEDFVNNGVLPSWLTATRDASARLLT